ncbi:hypothetical protein HG15A2_38120 [Adhaeretor mobilis]|uniref:Uncharacterized protein n=1 Tax=Adhaeretor mobilis TaxID=1930276 RepID=A0A517N043_9BACT|nr:hypothetical protein HG15A2_38120 [Adhaeretor mobilis]
MGSLLPWNQWLPGLCCMPATTKFSEESGVWQREALTPSRFQGNKLSMPPFSPDTNHAFMTCDRFDIVGE